MAKIQFVVKRNGAIVKFNPDRISNAIYRAAVAVGGRDKETAERLRDKVVEEIERKFNKNDKPHIEEIQDIVEKVLIENGHAKVAKEYILYRDEQKKRRAQNATQGTRPSENIPWPKIWQILDWSVSNNLHTIDLLNERIRNNGFSEVVNISEKLYEHDVDQAAKLIAEKASSLKMVMITGPSSSGKTTTTFKMEEKLKSKGMSFKPLVVDNYFFDLEIHPKDEFGDYDFETPQALDLDLINKHLHLLSQGEEVKIPYYDFKAGKRYLDRTPLQLKEGEVLLIDSLHALFPRFSEGIDSSMTFKVYLEPLVQLKGPDNKYVQWTDLRLIRRMLRDSVHRAYNPQQTLEHWHYVRSSELRHIIPYGNNADYIISSGMPYEIALYKPLMYEKFKEWEALYRDNPLREDAYKRAARVAKILEAVDGIVDNSPVPKSSVLREFIGGSIYEH
ncbi:MAG: response regulator SirA [Melioribacteraceae bacterium]|nr:response regulator SirA [Melioribacteraceae bacterium]